MLKRFFAYLLNVFRQMQLFLEFSKKCGKNIWKCEIYDIYLGYQIENIVF